MEMNESEILAELRAISARLKRQNSLWHMLWAGLVYGIGFFVGSAILATIVIGALAPVLGRVPWIHDAFVAGSSLHAK